MAVNVVIGRKCSLKCGHNNAHVMGKHPSRAETSGHFAYRLSEVLIVGGGESNRLTTAYL
jgi:hypothetical protein